VRVKADRQVRTPALGRGPALSGVVSGVIAAALILASCGPSREPAFVRAVATGDRAKTAGRHLEAAALYENAARATNDPRERDYALSLAASSYARAEDRADAARIYEALASGQGDYASHAAYERILLELRADPAKTIAALERFAYEHPSSALARRALLLRLSLDEGAQDPAARLAILSAILPRVRGTELEERVRYEIALTREQAGALAEALADHLALARDFPYPKGALFDDALYHAADLEDRLGRPEAAIAHLERMLKERETTSLIGSYERPKYLPAAKRIAELYRDRLDDPRRARDSYWRIYREFTHSTSRDDALFEAALLSRKLGEASETCRALDQLGRTFPDSRYVACAPKLCPSLAKAQDLRCADYIARRIDVAK
jgi:outer membrane protein assembly factor BamD (BamD/ComL family)